VTAAPDVGVGLGEGVASPFVYETFPSRVLSSAQIRLMPLMTPGRSSVPQFKSSVWFVWMKLEDDKVFEIRVGW